ncbi:MAG: hypothetical protein HY897_05115 [Deltaproteobacteria bacterium]|nr:hypothetical protein [Deltaproteobacteria bacterium]
MRLLTIFAVAILIVATSTADADVPPPADDLPLDVVACKTGSWGGICTVEGSPLLGRCRESTCYRWYEVAVGTPAQTRIACLKCVLADDDGSFDEPGGCALLPGAKTTREISALLLAGALAFLLFLTRRRR